MPDITPEERLLEMIKKAQGSLKMKKELKVFTKVNIILVSVIILIAGIFAMDAVRSKKSISGLKADISKLETRPLPQPAEVKDIAREEAQEAQIPKVEAAVPKKELTIDLNLLGIITGNENQAIIEDKKTNKTYFLYQGDSLEGFKVFSIGGTGVILDYKGEKIELKI